MVEAIDNAIKKVAGKPVGCENLFVNVKNVSNLVEILYYFIVNKKS